jgi:hypothetical protein
LFELAHHIDERKRRGTARLGDYDQVARFGKQRALLAERLAEQTLDAIAPHGIAHLTGHRDAES